MIIGITGTSGAGKGTVTDYLLQKGFTHYSVSEFIASEVRARGLPVNRDSLTDTANDLRKNYGGDYIVKELLKRAGEKEENAIIESIRSPLEVEALRKSPNFVLWSVDAKPEIRYARIIQRKSAKDNVTFEKFIEQENRELTSDDPYAQKISACMALADVHLSNNGTPKELYEQIEKAL